MSVAQLGVEESSARVGNGIVESVDKLVNIYFRGIGLGTKTLPVSKTYVLAN